MPRAAPVPSSKEVLKRYQACHRCRKQKLKCDGEHPCLPCHKSHAYAIRVDPLNAPEEPNCTYDDPDTKIVGPKARITALETENAELRLLLQQAKDKLAQCSCGASQMYQTASPLADNDFANPAPDSGLKPTVSPPGATISFQPTPSLGSSIPTPLSDPMSASMSFGALFDQSTSPPPTIPFTPSASPDAFALTTDVWPLNIPAPETLFHLVDTFFASVPLATRLIHKPTFMARLTLPPTSPEFPHVALLHAICGMASLFSPIIHDGRRDYPAEARPARPFASGIVSRPKGSDGVQLENVYPRNVDDILGPTPQGFGATHIQWAGHLLKVASRVGDRLLQQVQASIIISWYYYSTGVIVRCYAWAGTVANFIALLGLHVSEGYEPLSRFPAKMIFLMEPHKGPIDAETARNVFWIGYVLERIVSGGTVWPLQISDEDVSQRMSCRLTDFITGNYVPTLGRQTIFTDNFFNHHPSLSTDSWTLYVKATVLNSQIRNFNGRFRIAIKGQPAPDTEGFWKLDKTISEFVRSIPIAFKEPVEDKIDALLYMAHLLPHVAMIQLHDPHVDFNDPKNVSTSRLMSATESMMDLIHKVLATSFDLIYLDHATSFCWFVAGAATIRCLKAATERENEELIWKYTQNLQTVKFVLSNLGDRTTVGFRQIKLLNELYDDEVVPATKLNSGHIPQSTEVATAVSIVEELGI